MKPSNSEITTSPETPASAIGMPHGGHGLAMLLAGKAPAHATPDLARDILRCSPLFSARQAASQSEADEAREAVAYLSRPAPRHWIAGRVATLLSHYHQANTEEKLLQAVADDWCAMLEQYPAWAIANACRWWMGRENPKKHCKPLPGDIQDRAHAEMQMVRAAEITLGRGIAKPAPVERETQELTDAERERRRAIAESLLAGFGRREAAQ